MQQQLFQGLGENMAEAESSTDQRMCYEKEGVVFEDMEPLLMWASSPYSSLLAKKIVLNNMCVALSPEC